jgi:NTE family protein
MASPRIGLALGSGSAPGWSHIGVIEGLAKAGIHPDIVCGCSIGSVVGAAYVAGALPALKDFAQSLTLREIARFLDIRLQWLCCYPSHLALCTPRESVRNVLRPSAISP